MRRTHRTTPTAIRTPGIGAVRWRVILPALAICWTAGVAGAVAAAAAQAATAPASDDAILAAIEKAKAFLYAQRNEQGTWERAAERGGTMGNDVNGDQWGGLTSIATYALLYAGESSQDPRLQPAVDFLRQADIIGVYALGMRAQVWNLLPSTPENRQAVRRDAELLISGMKDLPQGGFWDYTIDSKTSRYDHSVSQYGVLGLWACADAGLEIPKETWEKIEHGWIRTQKPEGGWSYQKANKQPTTIMTAAGIATLFITQDQLHVTEAAEACRGNVNNPAIDRGIAWIVDHYDEIISERRYMYYGLYGIERIGVAGGHKYLGPIHWYQRGAEYLISQQSDAGAWDSHWGRGSDVADTAFGLLFLARGRAPLVLNKLQYDVQQDEAKATAGAAAAATTTNEPAAREGNWNQRPRDAAGLSRWIGKQTERDLHWQIVNLAAPVEELHDAPILYISGNQALRFSREQREKLKEYVETGGLILGNADCGERERAFAESFEALGQELFPEYRFRELPPTHVIYRNEQFQRSRWRTQPSVRGLSNGVRELMILIPTADAARAWQLQTDATKPELYELGANIFLYAMEKKNPRFRGQAHFVQADESIVPQREIRVARLKYDGNWDPEPGGWRRLAALLRNRRQIGLIVEPVDLSTGSLAGYSVAHLTGTGAIRFDSNARKQLQDFARAGGTLIVDAAGGAEAFARSIEPELKLTFPDHLSFFADPLPPEHPAYAAPNLVDADGDDDNDGSVGYRAYTRVNRVGRARTPRIRAMQVNDRPAVFFSAEDLSAGLVGQNVDGLYGYEPSSATNLMAKLIEYAASKAPPPPAASRPASSAPSSAP